MGRILQEHRGLAGRVLVLLAAAAALAAAANTLSPRRIPWREDWSNYIEAKALKAGITLVTPKQADAIVRDRSRIVFDARPEADYRAGHLPGAVSLPYDAIEDKFPDAQALLTPQQAIMTYCSGESCDESFLLTEFLKKQGFTNVVLFAAGFDTWRKAGYPVERSTP